jgi:co-chaperonin GroES (HSP10)
MRGQVVIRENLTSDTDQFTHIIVPELGTWEERQGKRMSHRGTVLAMGAPALTRRDMEVPPGFSVGDEVVFHWTHLEKAWTRPWIDGHPAVWVPQACVDAVVTP